MLLRLWYTANGKKCEISTSSRTNHKFMLGMLAVSALVLSCSLASSLAALCSDLISRGGDDDGDVAAQGFFHTTSAGLGLRGS